MERDGMASVSVLDLRGRQVARAFAGFVAAGAHHQVIDLGAGESGIRIVKLSVEGLGDVSRTILVER